MVVEDVAHVSLLPDHMGPCLKYKEPLMGGSHLDFLSSIVHFSEAATGGDATRLVLELLLQFLPLFLLLLVVVDKEGFSFLELIFFDLLFLFSL